MVDREVDVMALRFIENSITKADILLMKCPLKTCYYDNNKKHPWEVCETCGYIIKKIPYVGRPTRSYSPIAGGKLPGRG